MDGGDKEQTIEEAVAELEANDQVEFHENGTRTVTLTEPVQYNNQPVRTLKFKKPKGKDYRAMDRQKGDIGKSYALAGSLCGFPMRIFDDMEGDDALLCVAVAGTMGKKSRTSGQSSET